MDFRAIILNISMRVILQLSLIATFLKYAVCGELFYRYCVPLRNYDLRIPDNKIVEGEGKNFGDGWYTHVNWLDTPAGDMTLSYKIEYWKDQQWQFLSENTLDVYLEGDKEWYDLARLVRKALGLNHPHAKIPGKLRVFSKLFTDKCWIINFKQFYYDIYRYRIYLDVVDEDGNVLLTGQVRIPQR